jgi:hypothetical protein
VNEFTKAPWALYISEDAGLPPEGKYLVVDTKGRELPNSYPCVCIVSDLESLNKRDKANARLIVASPDMYTAIKELLDVPGIVDCMPVNIWDMLNNAIDKAEGKE